MIDGWRSRALGRATDGRPMRGEATTWLTESAHEGSVRWNVDHACRLKR